MVKQDKYMPGRGDVVWITLDPTLGHEQKGRQPAVVITHQSYAQRVGMCIVCPITSVTKNYPFEVGYESSHVSGAILTDQMRSMSVEGRDITFIAKLSKNKLREVMIKILTLLVVM
jgi:mRNA interferase MazF